MFTLLTLLRIIPPFGILPPCPIISLNMCDKRGKDTQHLNIELLFGKFLPRLQMTPCVLVYSNASVDLVLKHCESPILGLKPSDYYSRSPPFY